MPHTQLSQQAKAAAAILAQARVARWITSAAEAEQVQRAQSAEVCAAELAALQEQQYADVASDYERWRVARGL
jgi:hypothetical protein